MEELIARYGLIAIFVGSGMEGEPFALAGGVFAHRGWLSPYAVALTVIAGAFCIDQFWFNLSRNFRQTRLVGKMMGRPTFARAFGLIERHPILFILLFRFAYGLRAVAAVAIGVSQVPRRQVVLLNLAAASVWGLLYTGLGYALGPAFKRLEGQFGIGFTILSIGLSALALFLIIRRRRH